MKCNFHTILAYLKPTFALSGLPAHRHAGSVDFIKNERTDPLMVTGLITYFSATKV